MDKDYIKTSDFPYAAFLMLKNFTYIATVDPEDGSGRCEFYLTHGEEDIRNRIVDYANELRDELQGTQNDYVRFYKYLRMLRKSTYDERVIRKSQWEKKQ